MLDQKRNFPAVEQMLSAEALQDENFYCANSFLLHIRYSNSNKKEQS